MAGYEIDDFVNATFLELEEYADCMGLDVGLVRGLHHDRAGFDGAGVFGNEFVWFAHVDGVRFDLYVYRVNSWDHHFQVRTVEPFVLIHGTTFDGVRACWFSNTEPSNLPLMAQGLTWADEELRRRGWYL